ncbi:MAG: hypothetical protein ACE5HT_14770 [Gemmatimonadales bacterium]
MTIDQSELERIAKRLGRSAAKRLDVEGTARAVIERLKAEPVRVVWWRRTRVRQAMAAAALILLAVGVLGRAELTRTRVVVADVAVPMELQLLQVDELEEVFDSLQEEVPVHELAANLENLTEGQLRELLDIMEG